MALGDLSPILSYMQNRRNARDLRDYREATLAQNEAAQTERERAAKERERQTDDQIAITQQRANDLSTQTGIQREAADRLRDTDANRDTMSSLGPILDYSWNERGGVSTTPESFQTALSQDPLNTFRVMKNSAQFRALTDSRGVKYDEVTGIDQMPDGTFALRVKNQNTEGPLTVNGTSDNADPIQGLDLGTLNRVFNSGLAVTLTDGGNDAQGIRVRNTMNATRRPQMEAAAGEALGNQAGALAQAGNTQGVSAARAASLDIDAMSYDDLAGILRDNGMTDEEIASQFPREAVEPQQVSTNESEDRTGLSRDLTRMLESRDRMRGVAGFKPDSNLPEEVQATYSGRAERGARLAQEKEQEINDYAAGLEAEIAALEARSASNPRARRAFNARIQAKRRDLEYLNPTAATPDSELEGIDAPDVTLTRDNMIELITEKGWKPTQAQQDQVATQLRANNVTSFEQIPNVLGQREATLAMAVLATSDASMNLDQQMNLLNKMVNFSQTGDMDYGVANQIDDANYGSQLRLQWAQYDQNKLNAFDEAVEGASEKLEEFYLATEDRDLRYSDAAYIAPIAGVRAQYEGMTEPGNKLVAGRLMTEMFGLWALKYAESANRGLFQKLQDIARRDPDNQLTIDNISQRLVIDPEGKTFGFIDPIDNAGIREGEIPIDEVVQVFGREYTNYLSSLAATRPRVGM